MTKLEAAARQALEALVEADKYYDYDAIITALREALDHSADAGNKVSDHIADAGKVMLTKEQAQQIEEALNKLNSVYGLHETPCVAKALSTIRAARAQEQAEQELVAVYLGHTASMGDVFRLEKQIPVGAKLYAAPVRTKDLTDDEIMKINVDTAGIVPTCDRQFHFARAVIAADREKNK